ncbi:possible tellurite resistance protein [Acetobacter orientalis]|uniref:Possible tellurite resistance protein n=1 Tax=Acetobacter orientalis TaxID=146474 RepID=A0A2Z5ZJS2_9PROT|nr:possible tellurite resistance protein [Acetobacter orientalis]
MYTHPRPTCHDTPYPLAVYAHGTQAGGVLAPCGGRGLKA